MSSSGSTTTDRAVTGADRLWETHVGSDLAFLLARVNALSLARANSALAGLGLKARSYSVLALAASGSRPTQRELSDFLRLDPSQIVALVDGLAERDLVRREPDPNDRRVNVVVATEAGEELHRQAYRIAAEAEQETFAGVDADRRREIAATLRDVMR
ncbi:MarR family winged helix-turn-helix transcriptional regulator [Microbacterium sp. GXF7504]